MLPRFFNRRPVKHTAVNAPLRHMQYIPQAKADNTSAITKKDVKNAACPKRTPLSDPTEKALAELFDAVSDYLSPASRNKAALYPGYILYTSMRGADVERLQVYLCAISQSYGWSLPVAVDGIFGSATEQAVLFVQQQCGLTQNGLVNSVTWDCIARLYHSLI